MTDRALGANSISGGVQFRVWAPSANRVELALEGGERVQMHREDGGEWSLIVEGGRAGARYSFCLDGGQAYPDPYSRFQPDGVHGPSEVVIPAAAQRWNGLDPHDLAIYECHVGAFTPAGTFEAAIDRLPYLKALGVTALEVMPVAEFSGRWNWGYDGVDWYAPSCNYGGPSGLRQLIDAAHRHGLGVLLDVVYNHFGPEGNYLRQFSDGYFTGRHRTPWGDAINYEGCPRARQLAIENALYWLGSYGVDGLRLDATFAIYDGSSKHLLRELSEVVRAEHPKAILIAETHENDVRYLQSFEQGGFGFDAVWADDFHHTVRRRVAGDVEGYYQDYAGTMREIARTLNQGFLYEGQLSAYSGKPRGTPARDCPAWQFVYCLQNHDQVGNRAFGDRLSAAISSDLYRAASALLLLSPYTPLLFMGQEFAASSPFLYFTDHSPELGRLVTEGRRAEFQSFAAFRDPLARDRIPDPQSAETFEASKLDWRQVDDSSVLRLYQECLRLRRDDPVLCRRDRFSMHASAISEDALAIDYGERLLVVNFGDVSVTPDQRLGSVLLDTNDPRFGGSGRNDSRSVAPRSAVLYA